MNVKLNVIGDADISTREGEIKMNSGSLCVRNEVYGGIYTHTER